MIKAIRAQSPVLLTALFILISASFLIFFNVPQLEQLRAGNLGKIDGREITVEQFRLAQQAAHEGAILAYGQEVPTNVLKEMTWQRLLLLNEAKKLGIIVTDAEAADFILKRPFLQKEGKFDVERYNLFQKNYLPSRGISEERFEQIAREEVTLDKVRATILAPAQLTEGDLTRVLNEYFGSIKVNLIRWQQADFLKEIKVSPADLEKEYKDHSSNPAYQTPERRKVEFVSFLLTPEQMKLPDAAKATAKRALGEKATDFAVAVVDKINAQPEAWADLAKEKNLSSVATDFFGKDEPFPQLPTSLSFNRSAFLLTKDVPVSDAVEIDNGYVVIRLLDLQGNQLRPLNEIQSEVEQNVRERGAVAAVQKHVQEMVAAIKGELATGKAFPVVAKDLKLTVETPAAFSPWQVPPTLKDGNLIADATRTLQAGQLSSPIPSSSGVMLVFLDSRSPVDAALAGMMKPRVQDELQQQRRQQLMEEWFRLRLQKSDVSMPPALAGK